MSVNDILEVGRQGLNTQRQALQTTSNNIANANTPGYTRKRAEIGTNNLSIASGAHTGGVEVKKVIRIHDDFVQKQIVDESQALGGLKVKAETMHRLESVVARDGEHVSELVTKFFNDYRQLSANPETASLREIVGSSAESLTQGVRRMNDTFENMKRELDLRIGNTVENINSLTKEIAGLNDTITQSEARGDTPNDLYDRRDLLMREVSQKLDIQVSTDQRGQINIITGGNVLVQGNEQSDLTVARTPEKEGKTPGQVDIFVRNPGGAERPITTLIKEGELGGMLHVRDKVIGEAQNHLDKVAYQVATSVNSAHQKGVGLDGVGERNLFSDVGENAKGAAFRLDIADNVKKNRETIAAGMSGDPGDNRIALENAEIQNEKNLPTTNMGTTENHTINESINSLIGRVGVETQKEDSFFQHQQAVVDQLENYRQSVSGVSLEEEAVNMIQYQTVFNASAKAMKVGDELFKTILSLKD